MVNVEILNFFNIYRFYITAKSKMKNYVLIKSLLYIKKMPKVLDIDC